MKKTDLIKKAWLELGLNVPIGDVRARLARQGLEVSSTFAGKVRQRMLDMQSNGQVVAPTAPIATAPVPPKVSDNGQPVVVIPPEPAPTWQGGAPAPVFMTAKAIGRAISCGSELIHLMGTKEEAKAVIDAL